MPGLTNITRWSFASYWELTLFAVMQAMTRVSITVIQMMTVDEHQSWVYTRWCTDLATSGNCLVLAGIFCASCYAQRASVLGAAILYQAHGVLALPVASEEKTTEITMKSFQLAQASYKATVAMGAIMTALAVINSAIAIIQFRSRRRDDLPRNPAICEISAAAHAALGQPVSDDLGHDSGWELSSSASETTASANTEHTGSSGSELAKAPQRSAPMPTERLSRSPGADLSV
ncbi:hypothetical protein F4679DRAFT_404025 [Xylaria curta]|nr:hypothetical protein F4679DRAFT_404025 [Xylaria curta]